MSYDQFLAKYNGKYVDWDGRYGAQCMDLISFYSKELGLPHLTGNAADVANQYPAGYLHVSVPQRGDIVVFARNAANGYAGHIAIYDRPGFYFSQNYPTGSNSHIQYINEPIIAILRPLTQGGTIDTVSQERLDREIAASRLARRNLVGYVYLQELGRPPTAQEVDARQDQNPEAMIQEVKNSTEAQAYRKTNKLDQAKSKAQEIVNL